MTRLAFAGQLAALLLALLAPPSAARASCMYIPPPSSVTDAPAYNPATAVFLVRRGTRTIMTIEAQYEGPEAALSLVVPVPSAISRRQVRTISGEHFRRVDRATSPRLVHDFGRCDPNLGRRGRGLLGGAGRTGVAPMELPSVEIEDEWETDAYDVTVLSASESVGLLDFLRGRGLALPDEARSALRAYIETGHRFLLLQVDPARAERVDGQMVLSPVQIELESEALVVPVRLGTLNSPGEQELLLYVLSDAGRYEVANRPALIAPTGLALRREYAGGLERLYEGLLEVQFRRHPGATITEDVRGLGGGIPYGTLWAMGLGRVTSEEDRGSWRRMRHWTLTRIRHRYGSDLDDDLWLRVASERLRVGWPLAWQVSRSHDVFRSSFTVSHSDERCGGVREQSRVSEAWATGADPDGPPIWPGEALLEDLPSLGVMAGSRPPADWLSEPRMVEAPVEALVETDASPTDPVEAEPPRAPVARGGCAAAPGSPSSAWGLFALAWLLSCGCGASRGSGAGRRARSPRR